MALRWFDGFEQYGAIARMLEGVGGAGAWSQADSGWTLATTNPATQSYHLRMSESVHDGKAIRRVFGTASQIVGCGYRFNVAELPATDSGAVDGTQKQLMMLALRDVSNNEHIAIVMGTDGSVFARRGGTVLGRSDPCIAPGGYHHFECKAKIDNSTGYVEVRINEVTVLNLTGIDTQNTANATAAQIAIGVLGSVLNWSVGFSTYDVDDVYVWDTDSSDPENTIVDWVGDKGCYFRKPNADTAESGWAKSTGSTSYSLIDEVPPINTDYLTDATGAARTIVEVENLPGSVSEVIAWMPVLYPRKEDSGGVTMRGGVVVGADESYGPDDSPSTAYAYLRPAPKTIDPSTGVAWDNTTTPDLLIERTA